MKETLIHEADRWLMLAGIIIIVYNKAYDSVRTTHESMYFLGMLLLLVGFCLAVWNTRVEQ